LIARVWWRPLLETQLYDVSDWSRVAPIWAALAAGKPFFLLAESVGAWLDVFGPSLRPDLLVFRDRGQPVGACILVQRRQRGLRRVYLNTAGEDHADSACLEYNELVCLPGAELAIAQALRRHLGRWDELHVPWIAKGRSRSALEQVFGESPTVRASVSHHLDLAGMTSYVDQLGGKDRHKHRQNVRRYTALGPVVLDEAMTVEEAHAFLAALAVLHQKTWIARGETGSFGSELFLAYHRKLIERSFPLGRIQLLRLRAGDAVIGYHYNFVFDRKVWFYQCGYAYDLVDKAKPGNVLHAFAIQHAIDRGLAEYDLLAGDAEYKRRLGNAARPIDTLVWRAPSAKMRAYTMARSVRRVLGRLRREARFGTLETDLFARPATDRTPLGLPSDRAIQIAPLTPDQIDALGLAPGERDRRLARGDRCYGAWIDAHLAHYSWVQERGRHAIARAGTTVTLRPGELMIYNAFTHDQFRGNHLMARTLERILDDYFTAGFTNARIYVAKDNAASQRTVVRLRFEKSATLRSLRIGPYFRAR